MAVIKKKANIKGRPEYADPKNRKSVNMTVCLTPDIKRAFNRRAKSVCIAPATLARNIIEDYLK